MTRVRSATIEDMTNLRDCEVEIWESLREWLPDSFVSPNIGFIQRPEYLQGRQQLLQNKDAIFLLAEEDKHIIGLATGMAREDGVGMLGFIGVEKKHRKTGVGLTLLRTFLEEARKRKAHKVWLFTSPNLHPAIRLYVGERFVPEGYMRRHSYGLDLIIYSKFLDEQRNQKEN
jgi:ribosomal protein S18 acetylase RimI-like enzyme